MGTMLGFITTDVAISKDLLVKALKADIDDTFNMVSVDGDTSTNDTVLILANGLAKNACIAEEGEAYEIFKKALHAVNEHLAKSIAGDGEGCTKLFEVQAKGAATKADAKLLSKSVVCSSLTKAAVFGKDANWGRILCAMGYSGAEFDPELVDITLKSSAGELDIVKDGVATDYSEEFATKILSENPVIAVVDAKAGEFEATAWGCDLTYDYVSINADYRS
jgi:glutamate N-acetyltransferase/amino-acid N-acetyltransferase